MKKVKEELGQGKSFEELAKQYSEDTGSKEKAETLATLLLVKWLKNSKMLLTS